MGSSRGIYVCFLSVFIDMLGVSIVLPIVPYLALEFNSSPEEIGLLYAAYAAAQMISTPITGKLSDRFGRRPLLLMSLVGSACGFLVQGLANDYGVFVLGRVCAGAFGGSIPIAQAYIADVIPESGRPRYFAMLGSIITIAFMFGPGIGAGLSQFTLQTPMFVGSAIAAMGATLAFFTFVESERPAADGGPPGSTPASIPAGAVDEGATKGRQRGLSHEDAQVGSGSRDTHDVETPTSAATRSKVGVSDDSNSDLAPAADHDYHGSKQYGRLIRLMWIVSFCGVLGFSAYLYFFGLYIYDLYQYTSLEYGFISMATSVFCVIVQVVIFPKAVARFGKHGTGVIGNSMQAVGLVLLSLMTSDVKSFGGFPLMVIGLMCTGIGFSFFTPATTSILSRYASKEHRGSVLGVSQALQAFSRTIGPVIYGALYSQSRSIVFVAACIVSILGAVINMYVLVSNRQLPEHTKRGPKKIQLEKIDEEVVLSEDVALLQAELKKAIGLLDRYHRMEEALGKNLEDLEAVADSCNTAAHTTR